MLSYTKQKTISQTFLFTNFPFIIKISSLLHQKLPLVRPHSGPILHPAPHPSLKINRSPAKFFQTGVFGAPEALSSESKYNPPSLGMAMSPVTSIASQSDNEKKQKNFLLIYLKTDRKRNGQF